MFSYFYAEFYTDENKERSRILDFSISFFKGREESVVQVNDSYFREIQNLELVRRPPLGHGSPQISSSLFLAAATHAVLIAMVSLSESWRTD